MLLRLSQDFVVRKSVRKQGINIHATCVPKTCGIVQLYPVVWIYIVVYCFVCRHTSSCQLLMYLGGSTCVSTIF